MLGPRLPERTQSGGVASGVVHIVILGCGRVGSMLAERLDASGHSVAIIDQDASAFRKLSPSYSGQQIKGIGFDKETLETAGIARAQAFAAVSSGDNSNIIAARVARETYGVERVIARIYDPRRAEIYERLGIPTVATVSWTAGQILRRLTPAGSADEYRDPSGKVTLAEVALSPAWIARRARALERATGGRVAFITRYGDPVIPDEDTVVQEGDIVHMLFTEDQRERVERWCASGPEELT